MPILHWTKRFGCDYDRRSATMEELVDHCNEQTRIIAAQREDIKLLDNTFGDLVMRLTKLERQVNNNTNHGSGHGY